MNREQVKIGKNSPGYSHSTYFFIKKIQNACYCVIENSFKSRLKQLTNEDAKSISLRLLLKVLRAVS